MDFGFNRLFGVEPTEDLLIDFLNELLREEQGEIRSLTYIMIAQLGNSHVDRQAVFDLYCENDRAERFTVELQKAQQNFFNERIFENLFGQAEVADFCRADRIAHESRLKYYRDLNNVIETAEQKGRTLGREEDCTRGFNAADRKGLNKAKSSGRKKGSSSGARQESRRVSAVRAKR